LVLIEYTLLAEPETYALPLGITWVLYASDGTVSAKPRVNCSIDVFGDVEADAREFAVAHRCKALSSVHIS
jgi:hypothetical protein